MPNTDHICFTDTGLTGRERYRLEITFDRALPSALCGTKAAVIRDKHGKTLVELSTGGALRIYPGYAWDGPSGPAPDTPQFMRGSLVHDAFYQMLRHGLLFDLTGNPEDDEDRHDALREAADALLVEMCKEDGMGWKMRQVVWVAVQWFGSGAAHRRGGFVKPIQSPQVCYAPAKPPSTP